MADMPKVTLVRRGFVAVLLAFGLALMHGGIGQAMACDDMAQSASRAATTPMSGGSMPGSDPMAGSAQAHHHQPADQPVAAHAGMCLSTPTVIGGGSKAGPAVVGLMVGQFELISGASLTHNPKALGREPPPPDLVSQLCVIRI